MDVSRFTLITPRASSVTRWARPGHWSWPGNLPSLQDKVCHATINVDNLDPTCALSGLVVNQPREMKRARYILNNSFGMLGINSVVIVRSL